MYRLLILWAALLVLACDKKDDTAEVKTYREADLVGAWQLTAITSDKPYDFNGDGTPETDIYATYQTCAKTTILTLGAGGIGNQLSCNQTRDVYWSVSGTNFRWGYEGQGAMEEEILSLSGATLKTRYRTDPPGAGNIYVTTTYQKQ